MTNIDRENLTVESVGEAGLDISNYFYKDGYWWLPPSDAAHLVSWINNRTVDVKYLSNHVRRKSLSHWKPGGANFAFYRFSELIKIKVRDQRGRPSEATISDTGKDAIRKGQEERWKKWREAKENASV